jgi:hypothetical protein
MCAVTKGLIEAMLAASQWKKLKAWIGMTHRCLVSCTRVSQGKVNMYVLYALFLHTTC